MKASKVLLVTDTFMVDCGLAGKIMDAIKKGVEMELFPRVNPDPTDQNVREGLAAFKKANCQTVVDLGRWAVAVDAMWWLGSAAGPPMAGMIVERSGFELLAAFPLCTGVIGIALLMRVLRRFGSNRKASMT